MTTLRLFLKDHPIVLALYLPQVFMAVAVGLLIPILPIYAADFQISYGLIGLVIGAEALGIMIGDLPAGMISGQQGIRRTAMLGLIGIALSYFLLFFMDSIWLVIVLRFIGGFMRAFYQVAQHQYLTSRVVLEKRGRAISIYGGIYRLGKFIGPVIGGSIGLWFGLRAPFLLLAVLCVLATLVIVLFMQADMPTEKEKRDHPGHANIGAVLREHRRILMSAGSAQLLGQMIRGGRNTLIPLYAADVLGLDVATIGLIVGIGSFMDVLMVIPAGFVMDKLGRKWAIVPCFGLQALGMLFVPFSLTAPALIFAQVVMGLSNGIGSGSMMTLGSDLAPDDARGEFLGIWRFIGDGGFLGAPIIIGAVADILVLSSAAVVMSGAGFMAAGIFAVFVPETLKKDKQKRHTADA